MVSQGESERDAEQRERYAHGLQQGRVWARIYRSDVPLREVLKDLHRLRLEWTGDLGRDDLTVAEKDEARGFLAALEERIGELETDLG